MWGNIVLWPLPLIPPMTEVSSDEDQGASKIKPIFWITGENSKRGINEVVALCATPTNTVI